MQSPQCCFKNKVARLFAQQSAPFFLHLLLRKFWFASMIWCWGPVDVLCWLDNALCVIHLSSEAIKYLYTQSSKMLPPCPLHHIFPLIVTTFLFFLITDFWDLFVKPIISLWYFFLPFIFSVESRSLMLFKLTVFVILNELFCCSIHCPTVI